MSDLSQTKKYCFYTVTRYIYCHMYLHSPIFVQYTIVLHHCQTCEIKYGKFLLLLRSDILEEKHKSEITKNVMGKRKGVPINILKKQMLLPFEMSLPDPYKSKWMFLTWWVFISCLHVCLAALLPWTWSEDQRRWGYVVTLLVKVPILQVHFQ